MAMDFVGVQGGRGAAGLLHEEVIVSSSEGHKPFELVYPVRRKMERKVPAVAVMWPGLPIQTHPVASRSPLREENGCVTRSPTSVTR